MADLGSLADIGKLALGGVGGWLSRVFTERNKRRQMRRHLYKELFWNYTHLSGWVEMVREYHTRFGKQLTPLLRQFPNMEYYQHAKTDLNTYHELSESQYIDGYYDQLKLINEDRPLEQCFVIARSFVYSLEESFIASPLWDMRLVKRAMGIGYPRFEKRLAWVRKHGSDEPMPPEEIILPPQFFSEQR